MKYPLAWTKLFEEHQPFIDSENLTYFDPNNPNNQKKTFAVFFKVSNHDSSKVSNILNNKIPLSLKNKLLFQPPSGFHFTIQWSPEENLSQKKLTLLISDLKQLLTNYPPPKGDFYVPFFGRAGLYGLVKNEKDSEIQQLRQAIQKIWEQYGLTCGLQSKDYDLTYISLVRYLKKFTSMEIESLKNITQEIISDFTLNEIWIAINDKFLTPEKTTIIEKIKLN